MTTVEQLTLNRRMQLLEELHDLDYRRGFVEGHAKDTIAFQLRMLRKANGWEQREVAERLGNSKLQPMISRYENPDYGRYSIATLLELASVFDVALVARFAQFSELLEWDWSSDAKTLCPASFEEDVRLKQIAAHILDQQKNAVLAQGRTQVQKAMRMTSCQEALPQQSEPVLGRIAERKKGSVNVIRRVSAA